MKKYYRFEAWVVIKKIVAITASFNPVTVAHYKILSDAVEKCGADEGYDSSNDDCNPYFITIFDAEDDLCALLGVEPQNLISKNMRLKPTCTPVTGCSQYKSRRWKLWSSITKKRTDKIAQDYKLK